MSVAARLAEEIVRSEHPIGTLVGTEASLMERFEVSREPLREAIRILEGQALVSASRGRHSGLRIQAPAIVAAAKVLRTYLQLSDISLGEVLKCMSILQEYLLPHVVAQATGVQIASMRRKVAEVRREFERGSTDVRLNVDITMQIVSSAPDPVACLFLRALAETSVDFVHAGGLPQLRANANRRAVDLFDELIDTIERRDLEAAVATHYLLIQNAAESLSALERRNAKRLNTNSFLMGNYAQALRHDAGSPKRAARIAYKVAEHVRRTGMPPGTPLSLQSAGLAQNAASRAVLREAICLLEFFAVVAVGRGNVGGLYVSNSSPDHVLRFVQLYLRGMAVAPKHVAQLREHLGAAAVKLCAPRLSAADVLAMLHQVESLKKRSDPHEVSLVAREIRRLIFAGSGNRPLILFGNILVAHSREERGGHVHKPHPAARAGARCAEATMQLSTAFLKSNDAEGG